MAWQNTSRAYKQSVGGLCEKCMSKGMVTPAEIVHHKIPLTDDNINDLSISLSWDNLQALCRQCHAEAHEEMYRQRTGRRYKIDKYGKVLIIDPPPPTSV
jgi:5-methylcytosine-specific restriction endonuclease McrA